MYPHRIRLRGPWECEPPDGSPAFRVSFPCPWGEPPLSGLVGGVRFRRRFGYPGRIDADECVWITFAEAAGSVAVRLNDRLLGEPKDRASFEYEVTPLLGQRNEVVVEVDGAAVPRGAWGDVALEIRRANG